MVEIKRHWVGALPTRHYDFHTEPASTGPQKPPSVRANRIYGGRRFPIILS
jgi:hypothetical protein